MLNSAINDFKYSEEVKELFNKFIKPVTINDIERKAKWNLYENNIKEFIEEQLKIKINVYFTNNYKGRVWFYVIEGNGWFKSSDEIESYDMYSYEIALNNAIRYIFIKIYDIQ